jgi:hypothetical protein
MTPQQWVIASAIISALKLPTPGAPAEKTVEVTSPESTTSP